MQISGGVKLPSFKTVRVYDILCYYFLRYHKHNILVCKRRYTLKKVMLPILYNGTVTIYSSFNDM